MKLEPPTLVMDYDDLPYVVEKMRVTDIPEVMRIERQSFPTPWTANAYRYELRHNDRAHYYVVRQRVTGTLAETNRWWTPVRRLLRSPDHFPAPVLGYAGFWLIADEAHISTIAVHPGARRRGLGELLVARMLDQAIEMGAKFVTLEVRVSNHSAQSLYAKYGFERVGRRRGYYSDNREDAWIMTTAPLYDPAFQDRLVRNKETLRDKLWQQK